MPIKPFPPTSRGQESGASYADLLPIATWTHGKVTYVAGLLWEPLASAQGSRQAVRVYGAEHGLDTATVNKAANAMQAGYGVAARGAVPGTVSLAFVTASLLGDDFLGVFELDDETYALVGVMDGAIAPGADRIGDADTIRDEFTSIAEQYESGGRPFSRILAPEGFFGSGLHAEPVDLVSLLTPKAIKKTYRLRGIGKSAKGLRPEGAQHNRLPVVIMALLILAGGGGWYYWQDLQEQKAAAELAEQQRQAAAQAEAAWRQAQQSQVPPKPWVSTPRVPAFVAHCSTELGRLPLAAAGWELLEASCRADGLTATYVRTGTATVAQVQAALQTSLGVPPNIRSSGDEAGIAVGFAPPPAASEPLIAEAEARTAIVSHFQALDVPVTLTREPDPPPPSNNDGQPLPPPPPWVTYAVVVPATPVTAAVTRHHPSLLFDHLDVPGLRLEAIAVQRSSDAPFLMWSAVGRLYVDR